MHRIISHVFEKQHVAICSPCQSRYLAHREVLSPFPAPPSDNRVVTDSPYECEIVTPAVPTLPAQTHLRYVPFSKYSSLYYPPY